MFIEVSQLLGALAVFISSIASLLLALHSVRNEVKAVHTIVNSRTEVLVARVEQLTKVIADSTGIELPPSPDTTEVVE